MTVTLSDIERRLPRAKSYGNYLSGLCPYHADRKPSLLVWEDGYFRCLSCGAQGSIRNLYDKLAGVNLSTATFTKPSLSGPPLQRDMIWIEEMVDTAHDVLKRFNHLHWYLEQRGVMDRLELCRLGWYRGWYTIPIYGPQFVLWGVMLRASTEIEKASGQRFIQPPGQRNMMYVPNWHLLTTRKRIAVVFGMFDALTLSSLGYAVVTNSDGKSTFKADWLETYRKPIVIIPDKGEEDTARELALELGWRGSVLNLDFPDGMKDCNDFAKAGKIEMLRNQLEGTLGKES